MLRWAPLLTWMACAPAEPPAALVAEPSSFVASDVATGHAALVARSALLLDVDPDAALLDLRAATLAGHRAEADAGLAWLSGLDPDARARAAEAGQVDARLRGAATSMYAALQRDVALDPGLVAGVPTAAWRLREDASWRIRIASVPLANRLDSLGQLLHDGALLGTDTGLAVVATELDVVLVALADLQVQRLRGAVKTFRFLGDAAVVELVHGPVVSGWLGTKPVTLADGSTG